MPQNPAVRIIAFAALLLAVAVVVLAYTPWGQSLWQGKVAQEMGAAAIGGPFKLTDQNGKPRSDADFRGEYTLVFFGYTNCPDVCPTTLQTLTSDELFRKVTIDSSDVSPSAAGRTARTAHAPEML